LSVSKTCGVSNGIINKSEAAGLMRICWENLTRQTASVSICPSQIPHDLSWDRKPERRDGKRATYNPSDGTPLSFQCESHSMERDFRLSAYLKSYIVLNCDAKATSEVLIMTVNRENETIVAYCEAVLNNRLKSG
jgi:hypothetical protein